jgi:succinate dehydrogenase/fumarate reductase cytochrome b subunit (b558 family)
MTKTRSAWARKARKIHTLAGALGLGLFLTVHLVTNASALGGEARFASVVGAIQRGWILPWLEIVFVVGALGFHAGYGLRLLRRQGTADSEIDRYGDRRLWVVQRIVATIVLAFVLVHLFELRVQRLAFGLEPEAYYTILTTHLSWTWWGIPWVALVYLVGVAAASFHLANGLFAATSAWGMGHNRRAARISTSAIGLLLFLVGSATTIGLATGTRLLPARDGSIGDELGHSNVPCGPARRGANEGGVRPTGSSSPSH